jgi:murein DD-endopeptidase MepM/ murein hydrolase activator NlpD
LLPIKKSHFLSLILLLALALLPMPAGRSAGASAIWTVLTDDSFRAGPADFDSTAIQQVLERQESPLAGYEEPVGDEIFTAARSIFSAGISRDDTLNPQVLLAILYEDGRLLETAQTPFTLSMQEVSQHLWAAYDAYEAGERVLVLSNGLTVNIGEETNAASYALASYYAASARSEEELNECLERWEQAYLYLFNQDPNTKTLLLQSVADTEPFLQLPFYQPAGNFIRVNSFFDHVDPGKTFDDTLLRFDGRNFTGAGFSNCLLGVNCYGGHNGIDYDIKGSQPILAAASGKVIYRYYNTDSSKGTVDSGLIIDHGNGYRTAYWHMDPIQVALNANVAQGQVIGLSGNIGKSSGEHLHFNLRLSSNSKSVDPYGWWSASTDIWGDSRWMWAGDQIADNREAQAQLFFRNNWYRDPVGYLDESYYTFSVDTTGKSTNWAIWGTFIPTTATYHVYAYWPANSNNTRSARYQIFHAGGSTTVSADQAVGGDEFVLLGTFSMERGPAAVILTDFTSDSGRRVYFDAVKWAVRSIYPPTDIQLSQTSVNENVPIGTQVAAISTVDADIGDVHTYTLVSGTGSSDNAAFSISGSRLLTAVPLDFETKNSYSIRLRTTDNGGASFEKPFTITVIDVNDPPTSLSLSAATISENMPPDTTIGIFSTTDQDHGDTHTYALVSGTGSSDNGLYSISGNTLKTKAAFDFESKPLHSIRVRVTDKGGLWFEQVFNIQIIDVNEAPSNITLSNSRVVEKMPVGTLVGLLSAVDPDASDSHTFSLVAGSGDDDNDSFTIEGNSLLTDTVFLLEEKSICSIRIRVADREGLSFDKIFTITILLENLPPTNITLSKTTVPENRPVGTTVGSFTSTDPNEDETFTYMLVAGEGSEDNSFFTISGSSLKTAAVFNFEDRSSYTIRVRSTDRGGLFIEKAFVIQIIDVNEPPTALLLSHARVDENQPAGTVVGSFSASDPDAGDTHSYSLVTGPAGNVDNYAFRINGNSLVTAAVLDYEVRKSYSIHVRVTDSGGLFIEAPFTISIGDLNDPPTALELVGNEIAENNLVGDEIGIFTTRDQDTWDSHTYHLVPGPGDGDNDAFAISGDRLLAAVSFDYETQTFYSVRVRTVDQGGLWYETAFTISILPVNEYPPTGILLSRASVPEHYPSGTRVGFLSAIDADQGDWHTYHLVSGSGDQDNHLFAIDEDVLRSATWFDYEVRSSYSVRIRVIDSGDLWHEQVFQIAIEDRLEFFLPFLP